jgi:hypothetical protein
MDRSNDVSHAGTPATRASSAPTTPARGSGRPRDPDAIQAEMESVRERLAGTIDQLVYRSHPKTIAKREIDRVKARFVDDTGNPRTDNITVTAGAVVGVLMVMTVIRKVVNRNR